MRAEDKFRQNKNMLKFTPLEFETTYNLCS